MEKRNSNMSASVARAARRRSAVTIIAPGEATNPFHPDSVNGSLQRDPVPSHARFNDFKAAPHPDDVVNAAPVPAVRGLQAPPPSSSSSSSTSQHVALPSAPPQAARRLPANVSRASSAFPAATSAASSSRPPAQAGNFTPQRSVTPSAAIDATANGRRQRNQSSPSKPSTTSGTAGQRIEDGAVATAGGSNTSEVPNSASQRMQGMHLLPTTPPSAVMAAAQRGANPRVGYNAAIGPTTASAPLAPTPNPLGGVGGQGMNGSRNRSPRPAQEGSTVEQQQQQLQRRMMAGTGQSVTPRSAGYTQQQRRSSPQKGAYPNGPVPGNARLASAPPHQPSSAATSSSASNASAAVAVPSPPVAAKWTSASRRQSLNASAPNMMPYTEELAAGAAAATRRDFSGRRATVPQGTAPRQRVALVRVPQPPSRHDDATAHTVATESRSGGSLNRSPAVKEEEEEAGADGPSESGSQTPSELHNDSFTFLAGERRDSSIVIDDEKILSDEEDDKEEAAKSSLKSSSTSVQGSRALAPLRQPSPPADNLDFLRGSANTFNLAVPMAPFTPKKVSASSSKPTATTAATQAVKEEATRHDGDDASPGQSQQEGNRRQQGSSSSPNIVSPLSQGGASELDFSALMEPPSAFRGEKDTAAETTAKGSVAREGSRSRSGVPPSLSTREQSNVSFADFGLLGNGTTDSATPGVASTVSGTAATTSAASASNRRVRTAARPPSPVELNSMLLGGQSKKSNNNSSSTGDNPLQSTPLVNGSSRRGSQALFQGSKNKTADGSSSGAVSHISPGASLFSVNNWSFDGRARNGLSSEAAEKSNNDSADATPPQLDDITGLESISTPTTVRSPITTTTAAAARRDSAAEAKWSVTQSLSLNPNDFSFDCLPMNKRDSAVARLRKVFESKAKAQSKDEKGEAVGLSQSRRSSVVSSASTRITAPPSHTPLKQTNSLAFSTNSSVVAPRSEASSDESLDDLPVVAAGASAGVPVTLASLPAGAVTSMDFSFDQLSPTVSPARKTPLPPVVGNVSSSPQRRAKDTRTQASDVEFRFSWGASVDGGLLPSRHSAPSRQGSAAGKNTSVTLPSISVPGSECNFSLARFQNSNTSADMVNMFDRYDF